MLKNFKSTAERVMDPVSGAIRECGEQFLKTFEEIESEFRYHTYQCACEVMKLYSATRNSFTGEPGQDEYALAAMGISESGFMEENY